MTPLERLLAEELPTGTFGGPNPYTAPRPPREDLLTTTPEDQQRHYTDLAHAIHGWHWTDDPHNNHDPHTNARHLHPVPDRSAAA